MRSNTTIVSGEWWPEVVPGLPIGCAGPLSRLFSFYRKKTRQVCKGSLGNFGNFAALVIGRNWSKRWQYKGVGLHRGADLNFETESYCQTSHSARNI